MRRARHGQSLKDQNRSTVQWPSKTASRYVVDNERATTTVAYDLKPDLIPQDKLDQVHKVFTALFGKIEPIIARKRNEIIELDGQKGYSWK